MTVYHKLDTYIKNISSNSVAGEEYKLPSERVLVEKFNTTRITLREALTHLESKGLIYRSNRRGWYLAPPRFTLHLSKKVNFNEMAAEQGRVPFTHVCDIKRAVADQIAHSALNLRKNSKALMKLRRCRSLDGRCIMLEEIFMREYQFPGIANMDLSQSTTEILRNRYNVTVEHESTTIQVDALPQDVSQEMGAIRGAPCLQIDRLRFDKDKKRVDFCREYWLHSAVELMGVGY